MKRLRVTLTPGQSRGANTISIEEAIKELEKYRDSMQFKCDILIRRLADIGVNAAMMTLATKGQGDADRSAKFTVDINTAEGIVQGIITITSNPHVNIDGRVFYPHLAWEFGAGNYFNTVDHPKASELGFGPGTFPGQKHVPEPGFWYYRDENKDPIRSYGTQATMPMYNASKEIILQIEEIAREVFSGQ